jgi:hypothetical protein
MNLSTSGTAHCDTDPQPMMSTRPLNFIQNSIQWKAIEIGRYPMRRFISSFFRPPPCGSR